MELKSAIIILIDILSVYCWDGWSLILTGGIKEGIQDGRQWSSHRECLSGVVQFLFSSNLLWMTRKRDFPLAY